MKRIISLYVIIINCFLANSQEFQMPFQGTDSITTCSGKLYDAGGFYAYYPNWSDALLYIKPNRPNSSIVLKVDMLDIQKPDDYLAIFNDTSKGSSIHDNLAVLNHYYSSNYPNGKVSLVFHSNSVFYALGFEISIGCMSLHDTGDIKIENMVLPDSIVKGDTLNYLINLSSDFKFPVFDSIKVKTYLTVHNNLNAAFLIDSSVIYNITGGFYSINNSYVIPDTLQEGKYFIINEVETYNNLNERDYSNNIYIDSVRVLTPMTDIGFTGFSYNSDYFKSGISYCTYNVISKGNNNCKNWEVEGFLTKDRNLDSTCIPLNVSTSWDSYNLCYVSTLSFADSLNVSDSLYNLYLHFSNGCNTSAIDTSNYWYKKKIILNHTRVDISLNEARANEEVRYNNSFEYTFTLSCLGLIEPHSCKASIYLSKDKNFDKNLDTLLATKTCYNSQGWFGAVNNILQYPGTKKGTYFLLFILDEENLIPEVNENNNCTAVPILFRESFHDLELINSSFNFDEDVSNTDQATNTLYAKNNGDWADYINSIAYIISEDSILDDTDTIVDWEYYGGYLLPGESRKILIDLDLYNSVDFSNKYLITSLDHYYAITESNEQNNSFATYITEPDSSIATSKFVYRSKRIIVSDSITIYDNGGLGSYNNNSCDTLIIIPETAGAKLSLRVNNFVKNCCNEELKIYNGIISDTTSTGWFSLADTSVTQVFKSTDTTGAFSLIFNSDNEYVDDGFELYFNIDSIAPNSDGQLNNLAISNLVLHNIFLNDSTFEPGSPVFCNYSGLLKNLQSWRNINFGFYLSADSLLDESDRLLSSVKNSFQKFSPGFSNSEWIYLPTDIDTQNYFILCKLDNISTFSESNENNNTVCRKIKVVNATIDFCIRKLILNNSLLLEGESPNLRVVATTHGVSGQDGSVHASLYLSENSVLDGSDSLISTSAGTIQIGIGGGDMVIDFATWKIGLLPEGQYNLIAVINDDHAFRETDTTNNSIIIPIAIVPQECDLAILPSSIPDTIDNDFNVDENLIRIKNIGLTPAKNFLVETILSKDQIIDESDLILIYYYNYYEIIKPSETYKHPTQINLFQNIDTGLYFLIIKVLNYPDPSVDMDTTNNTLIIPLYIRPKYYDLQLSLVSSRTLYFCKDNLIEYNIVNNSVNYYSDSCRFKLFLSDNNKLDTNDYLLFHTDFKLDISPDEYYQLMVQLSLPSDFDTGNYFFIAAIDSKIDNYLQNNRTIDSVKILNYLNDIYITQLSFTDTSCILLPNTFCEGVFTLSNAGTNNLHDFSQGLYLSSDSIVNANSLLVWEKDYNELLADSYVTSDFNFIMPMVIPANIGYLVMVADRNNSLNCENAENNQYLVKIKNDCSNHNKLLEHENSENIIFPNPVNDILTVKLSELNKNKEVNIVSLDGEILYTQSTLMNLVNIDMKDFPNGCFILNIKTENTILSYKLIKQ